jgi:hypothetical protein
MQAVRGQLAQWTPPDPGPFGVERPVVPVVSAASSFRTAMREVPWWAQAAAAVLCIGVGLGAANLRVEYGAYGVTVRSGWMGPEPVAPVPRAPAGETAVEHGEWQSALAAVEQALRTEIQRTTARAVPMPSDSEPVLRQVRALLAESERRQQRELALRVGNLMNDVQTQRLVDLAKIDRSLGLIQNSTGMEVLRQREILNSLAVRVSQRP